MPHFDGHHPCDTFATISSVRPEDPASWDGRIFLSFDLDWANDQTIGDTIDMVEEAGVPATWFVTHETPVLERLRGNPSFELGIHPNFVPLLRGDPANGADAEEVIDRLMAIVPEAKSVRSHSLVQSGRLLELFSRKGLTHESNVFIPEQSGTAIKPWIDFFDMVRVPYFWADDFYLQAHSNAPLEELGSRSGVLGFGFHPIHVFLNCEMMDRYERARGDFRDPERLGHHRNLGETGIRDFLKQVLRLRR